MVTMLKLGVTSFNFGMGALYILALNGKDLRNNPRDLKWILVKWCYFLIHGIDYWRFLMNGNRFWRFCGTFFNLWS